MIDIIGYTNFGQVPLAKNWLLSLARVGIIDRATLYCVGQRAYDDLGDFAFSRLDFNLQLFEPSLGQVDEQADWGTIAFVAVVLGRLELLLKLCLIEPFRPFIQVDLDCAFVSNPLPMLEGFAGFDMWVQSNRLDNSPPAPHEFCNGIAYYRTPQADMLRDALRCLTMMLPSIGLGRYVDDEFALNEACVRCGVRRSALPLTMFPTGRLTWHDDSFIVHANWAIGLPAKIERLRSAGYWYLDELEATSCT